jgi:hypothetical protein
MVHSNVAPPARTLLWFGWQLFDNRRQMIRLIELEFNNPDHTLEIWLKRVIELEWNIAVEKFQNQWIVWSGDQDVLRTDSYEAVEAFLYGLSLAYTIIPDDLFAGFREQMKGR